MSPIPLHGLTADEVVAAARERLERGAGAAAEVYRRAMAGGDLDPAAAGLGPRSAAAWRERFALDLPEVVRVVEEPHREQPGAVVAKALLAFGDGRRVECVRIPMGRGRHTLCVSSQVGCRMGCRFCETARMGLVRQLAAHEIVGQVLAARHRLGWEVRNLVFMGMGEALDNAGALFQALRVLADRRGPGLAQERFTVCTVGHVAGLRRLYALGWRNLGLSFSLNVADDERRRRLMPITARWPLAEVKRTLAERPRRRNGVLAVNYCLMPGINDRVEDPELVARFCDGLGRTWVNVIPYNPGSAPIARAPEPDEVEGFVERLRGHGLAVRRRVTKGRSIMAACGQLGGAA